jgi:hypothetical protein
VSGWTLSAAPSTSECGEVIRTWGFWPKVLGERSIRLDPPQDPPAMDLLHFGPAIVDIEIELSQG